MNEVRQWNASRKTMSDYRTCDILLVFRLLLGRKTANNPGAKCNHSLKTAKIKGVDPADLSMPPAPHEHIPSPATDYLVQPVRLYHMTPR
jgi:hypothetical protein